MRRILVGVLLFSASIASAAEPVTVGELGRACATDIGNLQVELRATQIQAGKLQVEVNTLKEAAKTKEPVKE
jgi:cell division protein FtsL